MSAVLEKRSATMKKKEACAV